EDDKWVLPKRGVQAALKAAGLDKDFKLEASGELQHALMELYGSMIENAVQFGCTSAQMRKSGVLKPRDMAVYLERTWGIYIPGFPAEQLRPHRRPAASELHKQRTVATRQLQGELSANVA
ncbi:TFIID_20kDa domain-containing protein, partial [Haematococcus lacustris]